MGSGRQRRHLDLRRRQRLPVVGFELVQLVELEADVLDGQLQHVPEARQVLGDGPGVRVHVLPSKNRGRNNSLNT